MFEFVWPWMFYLAPLPLLMLALPAMRQSQGAALRVPFFARLQSLEQSPAMPQSQSRWPRIGLLLLLWFGLLGSAARPLWIGEATELPTTGRNVLMAVDISGSMRETDMQINGESVDRLSLVKHVLGPFIASRRGDRLGLILFGSQAYVQAPLTYDTETVQTLLNEALINFAGPNTAIGDAMGLAVKRLQQQDEGQRIIILLSDGSDTASQVKPAQAAKLAAQAGLRIYTVGIGATEQLVRGFFSNHSRNPSRDLDEDTLRTIAETTGGQYFRATNQDELRAIYETINELEPVEQDAETFRPQRSLLHWPLALAAVAALLLLALGRSTSEAGSA